MSVGTGLRINGTAGAHGDAAQWAGVTAAAGAVAAAAVLAALAAPHPLAVVAAFALGLLVVAGVRRPVWPLMAFVASVPLEYAVEYHPHPSWTITKAAGAYAAASFLVFAVRTRRPLRFDRSHLLLLGLLCVALASSAAAGQGMSTTVRYASWALLFFLVTQFRGEPDVARQLVRTLVVAGAVAGVWGCLNFLNGHTNLATLLYGQQNDFAFTLASISFLGLWLMRRESRAWRVVAAVGVACMLAGVLLSLSRGAWLSIAVATAFYTAFHRRDAKILVGVAVLAAAALAGFVAADPGRISEGRALKSHVAQENVDSRLTLWQGAATLAINSPLLGIGPGNFGDHYYDITHNPVETPPLTVAHETYLEVAAELGVPGLLLFLAFLGVTAHRLNEVVRAAPRRHNPAIYLRLSLISICVGFLTLSEEFFAPVWLIAALATLVWLEQPSASSR